MVKFALPKARLQILKKKPELVPLLETIYKKYGLSPLTKPIGSGTSNDVFDIGKGKILRVEISEIGKSKQEDYGITAIADELAKIPKYSPKLYEYKLYTTDGNRWGPWVPSIHTYVYEKIDIIAWPHWRDVYQSETELVNSLFGMISYLNRQSIYHSDPSANNIVLTTKGPMIIDTDVMCIASPTYLSKHELRTRDVKYLCGYANTLTGAYPGPEMYLAVASSAATRRAFKTTYAEWVKREYGIQELEYDARGIKPNLDRSIEDNARLWEANSIHAAGMIAHYAIMGVEARHSSLDPISFDGIPVSVRGRLRAAMHPNPSQRTLGSTRALSGRKAPAPAPARKASGRKAPARKASGRRAPARKGSDATLLKRHQALEKKNAPSPTVASLRKRCKQNGVKGYSKQRKSWLLKHCGGPHKSARRSSSVRRSLRSSKVSTTTQPRVSRSRLSVKELRARCKEKGVKRYSKQRHAWLVKNC